MLQHILTGADVPVAWVDLSAVRWATEMAAAVMAELDRIAARPHPDRRASGDQAILRERLQEVGGAKPIWLALVGLDPDRHASWLAQLGQLCANLPSRARVALVGHRQVGLPDLGGRLAEISEADLALLPDEAADLLAAIRPDLEIEVVSELVTLAEGWPAALRAGAEAPPAVGTPASWLTGPGLERLFADWFSRLEPQAREFLADTAVLDLLDAPSCDAVLGVCGPTAGATGGSPTVGSATAMLARLIADHAYLRQEQGLADLRDGTASGHSVWRRHGLLTRFLRQRAAGQPDTSARHILAAEHFRARGVVEQAMSHYVAAGRIADAGRYLSLVESDLMARGRAGDALSWYRALPTGAWESHAHHLLRIGWSGAIAGDLPTADLAIAKLQAHLGTGSRPPRSMTATLTLAPEPGAGRSAPADPPGELPDDELQMLVECDVLTAYVADFHADPGTMISAAQRAESGFAAAGGSGSAQLAPILLVRGLLLAGQPTAALAQLSRINRRSFPNDAIRESTLAGLVALCEVTGGRVHEARRIAGAAVAWADRLGPGTQGSGMFGAPMALAVADLESAELRRAGERLGDLLTQANRCAHHGQEAFVLGYQARLHTLRGDWDAAAAALMQARSIAVRATPGSLMLSLIAQHEAALRIACGELPAARRIIRELPASPERTLLWVRANLRGNETASRRTLTAMSPITARGKAERHLLHAAAESPRSTRLAQGHLRRAAEIAASCGMATLLCDCPAGIAELAGELAAHDGSGSAAAWLLATRDAILDCRPVPVERPRHGLLSVGELELVSLLPTRSSNADLASVLGVSTNTVKTRLRRLYTKLEVHNRDEAVSRAVELGYFSG